MFCVAETRFLMKGSGRMGHGLIIEMLVQRFDRKQGFLLGK